jgi:deferrochelatase/peroxidase EfeB
MASASRVDLADIQGLLRFGYGRHSQACFLLLRVKDAAAARAWLAGAPVADAMRAESPPPTVLQVALTATGLRAIGVPGDIVDGFSIDFVAGMASDPSRARRLGDIGASAPERWQWGWGEATPHVLLLLYAMPGRLADFQREIEAQCAAGFDVLARLATTDMHGNEPFGFADGLSQPELDWQRERAVSDEDRLAYSNLCCLGEFILGYPNEYGQYTDRPLLDAARDGAALLPRAEDAPGRADLGRNGSYLVLRQLAQDVTGFWRHVDVQAGGDPHARVHLAQAMVGRTLRGAPLVDPAVADQNAFDFASDPRGLRCPLGAHIRRANPRNADLPAGGDGLLSRLVRMLGFDALARERDLVASTRFHRLLRRGREYGDELTPDQALAGWPVQSPPGLHFLCLNANIARQFEFVQAAWMMGTKFDGLRDEGDPMLGHREPTPQGTPTDEFSLPCLDGPDQRLRGLPRFVSVLGGAYFFLPGLRALRFLASVR